MKHASIRKDKDRLGGEEVRRQGGIKVLMLWGWEARRQYIEKNEWLIGRPSSIIPLINTYSCLF